MKRDDRGFTIVELLLAMAFFAFIMMMVVAGFIQINRSYTKGLTVKQVQNTARTVIEDITRTMRDAEAGDVVINSASRRLCIGGIRYGWNQSNTALNGFTTETYADNPQQISLVRTTDGAVCTAGMYQAPASGESVSLLDATIVVQHLGVSRIGATNSFNLTLIISTATTSDFTGFGTNAACRVTTGDQFCDVARIDTVVTTRN